jgi:ribosomal protein S6
MIKKEFELYELLVLFKYTTVEKITQERISFYKNFINDKGTQVIAQNNGQKSLAYPIKGFRTATSLQFIYLGNDTLIQQMNVELQRDEFVLRALTTKLMDQNEANIFN